MSLWLLGVEAKLRAAWVWVMAHWKWLLPPVAALVWYFTRSKNLTVASGAIVEHGSVVAKADEKAAIESAAVQSAATDELHSIAEKQAADVEELNTELKGDADSALKSPEDTNEFLKSVSSGMRK